MTRKEKIDIIEIVAKKRPELLSYAYGYLLHTPHDIDTFIDDWYKCALMLKSSMGGKNHE